MSAEKQPQGRRPPGSVAEAAKRLAAIVEAAEHAASTVLDEAEEEAQRRIEEASVRADRLVAERLRALADELDPPPREAGSLARLTRIDRSGDPPDRGRARQPRSASAGARLLATQMAVCGASREEIEARLRSEFEIGDPSEILDAILGPED